MALLVVTVSEVVHELGHAAVFREAVVPDLLNKDVAEFDRVVADFCHPDEVVVVAIRGGVEVEHVVIGSDGEISIAGVVGDDGSGR